eukprot:SAG11_NODE_4_length_33019_cov_28.098909_19_plen_329_part_00
MFDRLAQSAGAPPLFVAAQRGSVDALRLLLSAGNVEDQVHCRTRAGGTPLLVAAEQGHEHIVEILLEHMGREATADGQSQRCTEMAWQLPEAMVAASKWKHASVVWRLAGELWGQGSSGCAYGDQLSEALERVAESMLARARLAAPPPAEAAEHGGETAVVASAQPRVAVGQRTKLAAMVQRGDSHADAVLAVLWSLAQTPLICAHRRLSWALCALRRQAEAAGAACAGGGGKVTSQSLVWRLVSADLAELIARRALGGGALAGLCTAIDEQAAMSLGRGEVPWAAGCERGTKREKVEWLCRWCSYDFLRRHRLCGKCVSCRPMDRAV